jgi:hypothetical protein
LSVAAIWTAVNGLIADWNYTHVFNPEWPPHAKYHDALSIIVGILLGVVALGYLWRRDAKSTDDLEFSIVCMSVFWLTLLLGFTFPGTGGTASEHPEFVPKVAGIRLNEVFIGIVSLTPTLVAYFYERRRRNTER